MRILKDLFILLDKILSLLLCRCNIRDVFLQAMAIYSTEITSDQISSDNPIHQRLLMPYMYIKEQVKGDVLEIGCGEGRGVNLLIDQSDSFTAVDKIGEVIDRLSESYPKGRFIQMNLPPLMGLEDNSYDIIISFQVIEHIKNDKLYLEEIKRLLKPGGRAFITTPNVKKTLTRNPWHIREYTAKELNSLASSIFENVKLEGIGGNEKVWQYYEENRESVKKITRWDILNLQYHLPSWILRIPYELLNRANRNKLEKQSGGLASEITFSDYIHVEDPEKGLDHFLVLTK